MAVPKLFISYSWTTPEHAQRVLSLSTELRESGVDVILDKWDLKEGHDAHAFMEQMVTDSTVKKVLLICDMAYVEKANARKGGVGTEAQIVSGEIYKTKGQEKFVAVVTECDDDGRPCLPAYYGSRIYINLTDPSTYSDNFEQLLRWIYDKPLYRKPELGKPPAFLSEKAGAVPLATSARFKRAIDAVRSNKPHSISAMAEYFESLTEQLEKLRILRTSEPFDDLVIASIESFLPHRNEAIELFLAIALHLDTPETRDKMHRFFESLIPYLNRPQNVTSWQDTDFDNFKLVVHELFLYAIASLLRYDRFDAVAHLLSTEYYAPGEEDYGQSDMKIFSVFGCSPLSLEHRNTRLKLNRLSLHADLLKQRCTGVAVQFKQIMQADFIVFLRATLHEDSRWWPSTMIYASHRFSAAAFEVFARAKSLSYFNKFKVVLGIQSKEDLEQLLKKFDSGEIRLPGWQYHSIDPHGLLGIKAMGTKA
jgi:hypothetical protein